MNMPESVHLFAFRAIISLLLVQCLTSAPLDALTFYDDFISDIKQNNCVIPNHVILPIENETKHDIDVFSPLLGVCQKIQEKLSKESFAICSQVFTLLKNISCHRSMVVLPEINVTLSSQVCQDFGELRESLPDGFLKHLSESYFCEIACDGSYNTTCQLLLWSYQVLQNITDGISKWYSESIAEAEINEKVFHFKVENEQKPTSSEIQNPDKSLIVQGETKNDASIVSTEANPNRNQTPQTTVALIGQEIKSEDVKNSNDALEKIESPGPEYKDLPSQSDSENDNQPQKISDESEVEMKVSFASENSGNASPSDSKALKENINPDLTTDHVSKDIKSQTTLKSGTSSSMVGVQTSVQQKQEKEQPSNKAISDQNVEAVKVDTKSDNLTRADLPIELGKPKTNENPETQNVKVTKATSSSSMAAALENMDGGEIPLPMSKDTDQYTDLENGGMDDEYSKAEYDGVANEAKEKERKPEPPKVIASGVDEMHGFDDFTMREQTYRRGPEDIPIISSFPEQEDSHFFFYFLSLVLMLMAGYLIFHNKQKIIALIVEGRHDRGRRRSHGVSYKKLDTK